MKLEISSDVCLILRNESGSGSPNVTCLGLGLKVMFVLAKGWGEQRYSAGRESWHMTVV